MTPLTLRRLPVLLASALTALALLLSGCSASEAAEEEAGPSTGWSFTDDLGRTVTLDARPTRVAGLSDVLYSLVNYGLRPVAGFGWVGIAGDPRFEGLDTTGLAEVGTTYGEIDLEALAAADPELIVTNAYPTDAAGTVDPEAPLYGFADREQQAKVEAIAPVVAITMAGTATDVIARTTELAVALGAAPDSGPVAQGRAAFDRAAAGLRTAGERGVTVAAVYGEAANVYVAKAPDDPSLRMYSELGVRFVPAQTEAYYWDVLSWEAFDSIGGDVLLHSQRGFDRSALLEQPTVAASPVGKAGQIHPWVFAGMDYVSQAAYMEQLAGFLTEAEKLA